MTPVLERKQAKAILSIMFVVQIVSLGLHFGEKWRSSDVTSARDFRDTSYLVNFESNIRIHGDVDKRQLRPKANKATKATTTQLSSNIPSVKSSKGDSSEDVSEVVTATVTNLSMTLEGTDELPESSQATFEKLLADYSKTSVSGELAGSVSNFQTSIKVTDSGQQRMLRSATPNRVLQDKAAVVVVYTQTMEYASSNPSITPMLLATNPFDSAEGQQGFEAMLSSSGDPILQNVDKVSGVTVAATPPPTTIFATPSPAPIAAPVGSPTYSPTTSPMASPGSPTSAPTESPTSSPIAPVDPGTPTSSPTQTPSLVSVPTTFPTGSPGAEPTGAPSSSPFSSPSSLPQPPTSSPTGSPIEEPTGAPSNIPFATPSSIPERTTSSPTGNSACGVTEDYSQCAIVATFECKINFSNLQCDEVTVDDCTIGTFLSVTWKVYNPECDQDISTTCTGFPGCFGGTESYPGCYSNEIHATYEITECLTGGETEQLTFKAVAGSPATDMCSFSKTYCNAFRISDEPSGSTFTNDDTCVNPTDGCAT